MDLRAVRAKGMRMKGRCGVVPAFIGFAIRFTFAGPPGGSVPTMDRSEERSKALFVGDAVFVGEVFCGLGIFVFEGYVDFSQRFGFLFSC